MLAVTGIGMVTSLGLDVVSSCAAARAGLQRVVEIDDYIVNDADGEQAALVAVHRTPLISAGFFGFARLLQLGTAGLTDLLRSSDKQEEAHVGFVLVVGGETYRSAWLNLARQEPDVADKDLDAYAGSIRFAEERIVARLLEALVKRVGLTTANERVTTCATAVGFAGAIQQADKWLSEGVCDRCVLGGLDSLLDPTTLEALDGLAILRTPERAVGLIPGEAACFLMVETPAMAARRGVHVQASLESPGTALGAAHPKLRHETPGRDALPDAITTTFAGLADRGQSTGLAVVNLNGDPYRAFGWSAASMQVLGPMRLSEIPVWIPALSFGDTGAATGPVSVALLARAWARGYAPSRNAVICLMDDFGERAAVYVRLGLQS